MTINDSIFIGKTKNHFLWITFSPIEQRLTQRLKILRIEIILKSLNSTKNLVIFRINCVI